MHSRFFHIIGSVLLGFYVLVATGSVQANPYWEADHSIYHQRSMNTLAIEPQDGINPIIQLINQSHREIDLGVYYLSDRKILSALKAACERGVKVQVMVEPKPYGMKPWQILKEVRAIVATGARFKWVPSRFVSHDGHYLFYHAKYICNEHECEIGTANFDWSAFHRNREYLYVTNNSAMVHAVHLVFQSDWNREHTKVFAHKILVLSPKSTDRLLEVIRQPGAIDIESEELGNDSQILSNLAAKGRELRLILPSTISQDDQHNVVYLREQGCQVRFFSKKRIYMHAKMIVGNKWAFIGSENFTWTSLQNNREMGVILNGLDITKLQTQFNWDWKLAGTGKTN
jgi:phosphatidylserine/phosphatidylglycerophosphate/cardiolipin synthase-like enzyme